MTLVPWRPRCRKAERGRASALLTGLLACALFAGCPGNDSGFVHVTGQIEARDVDAGSRIGGRVLRVHVAEGDLVKQGDTLVELDAAEARAVLAAAEAQLLGREAALAKLVNGATQEQLRQAEAAAEATAAQLAMALRGARDEEIRTAAANMEAAEARRDEAQKEFERIQNLRNQEVASQSQFDHAKAALDAAEAQFRGAREQRDLALAGSRAEEIAVARANNARAEAALAELRRGAREEDIASAEAARDAAQAEVARARVALEEMTVTAPQDGVIESLDLQPGDLLNPGPAVRIVDPENLEVTFYVSALLLGQLAIQQEVTFTADAFGEELFAGHITRIADEGEFTPRNLQTEEERVQQVFGVTVALDSHGGKLRPGMSVTARFPANGAVDLVSVTNDLVRTPKAVFSANAEIQEPAHASHLTPLDSRLRRKDAVGLQYSLAGVRSPRFLKSIAPNGDIF